MVTVYEIVTAPLWECIGDIPQPWPRVISPNICTPPQAYSITYTTDKIYYYDRQVRTCLLQLKTSH